MTDFRTMDINTIANGISGDGVPLLELFLQEYTKLFDEKVNPSCSQCLKNYVEKYKRKMAENNLNPENSGFVLKAMFHGLQTDYNDQFVCVTNENLTDDLVRHLSKRPDFDNLFHKLPEGFDKEAFLAEETVKKGKPGRKSKKEKTETPETPETPETEIEVKDQEEVKPE